MHLGNCARFPRVRGGCRSKWLPLITGVVLAMGSQRGLASAITVDDGGNALTGDTAAAGAQGSATAPNGGYGSNTESVTPPQPTGYTSVTINAAGGNGGAGGNAASTGVSGAGGRGGVGGAVTIVNSVADSSGPDVSTAANADPTGDVALGNAGWLRRKALTCSAARRRSPNRRTSWPPPTTRPRCGSSLPSVA